MTTYRWNPGAHIKGDAQAIGERVAQLQSEHGDNLAPEMIWRDGISETSPLHKCFEWDKDKAAQAHWNAQAGAILRSIRVVMIDSTGEEKLQRVYLNLTESVEGQAKRGYVSVARVLESDDLRQQAIVEARKELLSFKRRYAEIADLVEIIDKALAQVSLSLLETESAA